MKIKKIFGLLVFVQLFVLIKGFTFASSKDGSYYYDLGQKQEAAKFYAKALKSYSKAAALFIKEGRSENLILAKNGCYRARCVLEDFSYSTSKFKSEIKKKYPWATKEQIAGWLATKPLATMQLNGGKTFYSTGEVANLAYRDQEIMNASMKYKNNPVSKFMDFMLETYVKADYSDFSIPYDRPKDILADFQLVMKKSSLPRNGDGIVRVWWPMPINTDCQNSILIISIEPSEYIVKQTGPDADIGLCYFEIPISDIGKELLIRSQVRFKHFQQRFVVDPQVIGQYDTESDLYKKYTSPTLNTAITDKIKARASQIVGDETNPYLQAKMLNDYIIANVDYSFPEYDVVDAYMTPLSSYVEEHQFGDCGYQSVYFAAMCRSLGIPARSAGGYQYFSGRPGSHFWAEFYLPKPYNSWVPVDVTASELYKEVLGYSQEDLKAYSDYFFAQQDPMRMVIQHDVDFPLVPEDDGGKYYFKACVQEPVILCYGADKIVTMFSKQRKFYTEGTYSFNYDDAIRAKAGAEIQLNAGSFGLESFNGKTKFKILDRYLGKNVAKKLKIREFNPDKTAVTLVLPENIQEIAYRITCATPRQEETVSDRWVIISK